VRRKKKKNYPIVLPEKREVYSGSSGRTSALD